MPLEEYKKKRDFKRTPEPPGEVRGEGGRSYCIQKHAASRLHYDFRLEHDGVLLSWAVPKGPSFDTREKRLAMHVEDHPVEYGSFEGVIPEGEYGGGAVVLWDRGTWEPLTDPTQALKRGELKFVLHGEKLQGKWVLVQIKGDEAQKAWLLIKEKDDHSRTAADPEIVATRPESVVSGRGLAEVAAERDQVWHSRSVGPGGEVGPGGPAEGEGGAAMRLADLPGVERGALPRTQPLALATVVEVPPAGDEWLHEIKHDGYRIVARIDEGDVQLVSRNGKDWTKEFPQVARGVGRLPAGTALLDGEVAAVLPSGATSFQALQRRADAAVTLVYFVFDLLHLDGWDLRQVPLQRRKEVLQRLLESAPETLRFSDHVRGQGPEFYERAREAGLEGVISKRADAPYRAGRGGDWLKAKCRLTQEFVVGGWRWTSDGRQSSIGALHVGFYENEELVYAGRVGSGLSGRMVDDLQRRLEARRRDTPPFAETPPSWSKDSVWVEPDLVAQVEFTQWTDEGRLRQPVFLGLRDDRDPRHVVRERPGTVEGGGVDTVSAGRPWEALRSHATRSIDSGSGEEIAELLGVRLTHPDRIYYPDLGFTKLDLALYYVSIADAVLPHLAGRPLTLVRCPEGVDGETFYQKHPSSWTLPQLKTFDVPGKSERYLHLDSVPGLIALAQAGILEIHPWNSRVAHLERPDQVIFDLDPDESLPFSRVAAAARQVRALLRDECQLESFVKTTGGKGLHVCVPLAPERSWDELEAFTRAVAQRLARDDPKSFTANMAKAQRKGKVFVDYLRNTRGANAVGVYSTRARAGAPVSVPVDWGELDRLSGPTDFTVAEAPLRVLGFRSGTPPDPWAGYLELKQRVPESLTRSLEG